MAKGEHYHTLFCCRAAASVVLLFVLALNSCSAAPRQITLKCLSVFSDFTFVGAVQYQPLSNGIAPGTDTLPKHGTAELPLPNRLEIGIQYIFHHRGTVDDERLALVIFPTRLRSADITITKSPRSSKDLMYLFVGGPAFTISIKEAHHEGIIYNQIDPDLLKSSPEQEWAEEDYVLLWLK